MYIPGWIREGKIRRKLNMSEMVMLAGPHHRLPPPFTQLYNCSSSHPPSSPARSGSFTPQSSHAYPNLAPQYLPLPIKRNATSPLIIPHSSSSPMAPAAAAAAKEEMHSVLVTGGAGFIGTHTVLQLLKDGFRVTIIDNLDNSVEEAVDRVRDLAGPALSNNLTFFLGDLRNKEDLEKVFSKAKYDAVIHFAGLKAVGESVAKPHLYFDNNLIGTLNLYEIMGKYGCKKMVFSSSATVYGQPEKVPCVEDFELRAMNPYGRTKLFLEEIARDIQKADPEWKIILLRYFNPVGAHESGQIGEDPKGIPNNLMPYIQQVAVGRLPELNVYGYDYPTKDGSAVRDYIHVMDLADGHLAALEKLLATEKIGCVAYNLGTGCGTSVLEMVAGFEKAAGKKIPLKLCPRRPGDATSVYASTEKAQKELGWRAKYGVEEMCRDQWNWARKNPYGYRPKP